MVYNDYPIKGELNSVWEIVESDIKFIYTMKLVPLEYLGVWEANVLNCWKLSMQALSNFFVSRDATSVRGARCNEEEASPNSPK